MKHKKYQKAIEKLKMQYPQFEWEFSDGFLATVDGIVKEHRDALKALADK